MARKVHDKARLKPRNVDYYSSTPARSQNFEKRLLASSCLSVHPHGKTWLPLDGFS